MREEVRRDLSASRAAFVNQVWPVLAPHVGGGFVLDLEGLRDVVGDWFDRVAGYDWMQIIPSGLAMRGIASRVQPGRRWETFTIRLDRSSGATTEWEKRLFAVQNAERGFAFPGLTVQAYISDEGLITAGAVWTAYLVRFIEQAQVQPGVWPSRNGPSGVWVRSTSNARFIAVSWAALQAAGIQVVIATGRPKTDAA